MAIFRWVPNQGATFNDVEKLKGTEGGLTDYLHRACPAMGNGKRDIDRKV